MRKLLSKITNRFQAFLFRFRGIVIPSSVKLGNNIYLQRGYATQPGKIKISASTELCKGVVIKAYGGTVNVQANVFLGEYVVIYGHGGVEIGPNTLIAMHTCIVSSNHTTPGQGELIRSKPDILLPVKIGSDVWIGAGCKILGGVTIGEGCVVGAGSVIHKDLPAYSISVGNPAKVIKYRNVK